MSKIAGLIEPVGFVSRLQSPTIPFYAFEQGELTHPQTGAGALTLP